MAGVTQEKAWFRKGRVCSSLILKKSKAPRKSTEMWILRSLAFYNAPSLHTVNHTMTKEPWESLRIGGDMLLSIFGFWTTASPNDRFAVPLAANWRTRRVKRFLTRRGKVP